MKAMPRVVSHPVALVACLFGLAVPCAASASAAVAPDQQFAVGSADMAAAQQVAATYWGATACGGKVEIVWTDLPTDTNAISSWTNPTSAYDNPTQNGGCLVRFNRLLGFDWPRFCTVLVHEFGHLTGHDHSPDAHDVMAAYYGGPIAACEAAPAPVAPAVVPVAAPAQPTAVTASNRSTPKAHHVRPRTRAKHHKAHPRRHHHRRLHARHRSR